MLVVLEGATQVCDVLQTLDGGQPPQVPPQPSVPHVLPVQFDVHDTVPPLEELPDEELVDAPLEELPDEELVDAPLEELPDEELVDAPLEEPPDEEPVDASAEEPPDEELVDAPLDDAPDVELVDDELDEDPEDDFEPPLLEEPPLFPPLDPLPEEPEPLEASPASGVVCESELEEQAPAPKPIAAENARMPGTKDLCMASDLLSERVS
jgi:hypothetical protein